VIGETKWYANLKKMEADNQVISEWTHQLIAFLDKNEAILKEIDEGVIVFDLAGKAAVANSSAARLLERPVREIMRCDVSTLAGKEVNINGQEQALDLRQGDKALLINLVPIHDAWGQRICTVAVFHNLLQEAELDRARDDFVSLASHELRTPLSAVLGYIDMLKEDVYGPLTNQQRSAVERAAANTEQLVSLVNNLLDQAQIQAGGLTLNHVPFSPIKLIDSVQTVMTLAARRKGLQLTTSIADDVPAMLTGDFQRLCQVVATLLDNAVKFTDSGTIHVGIYKPSTHHWAVEVSDTGCGIPPEAQRDIFAPFRQADDPMRREYRGAGLGLSIARQLVDRMGGEIKLESEVGLGSTFTVVLPFNLDIIEGLPSKDSGESVGT
jgi:signal transduction histidine kinase